MNEQDLKTLLVIAVASTATLYMVTRIQKRKLQQKQKSINNCVSALELSQAMMSEMVEKNPDTRLSRKTVEGMQALNIMMRNGF